MSTRTLSPPLAICLTGFPPDVVSRLPQWGGNVRWNAAEGDLYDYQFSIQPLSDAKYRDITLTIAQSQPDARHHVELKVAGSDEETILQLLSHCLLLPSVHDGLIGIDHADFVTALRLARTGVLLDSKAVHIDTAIAELQARLATARIDHARACSIALCHSQPSDRIRPDLNQLLVHPEKFGNEDTLQLVAAVHGGTSPPQTTLLILH